MIKMSEKRKILNNYAYNLCYEILLIIAPLVTTPYISRVLGVDNIGIVSYTTSLVSYFSMIALFGIHTYGFREVAFNQNNIIERTKIFKQVQKLKVLTVSCAIIFYAVAILYYNEYTSIMIVQGIALVSCYFDISWIYTGLEDFKSITVRNILVKLSSIVMIFLLVRKSDDLFLYIGIQVIATLAGNLFLWKGLSSYILVKGISGYPAFHDFKTIVELFLPSIAIKVYNVLDKTMLGYITHSMTENGYYEQTTKVTSMCLIVITAMSTVIAPNMAAKYASNDIEGIKSTADKTLHFINFLSCGISFGIMAISDFFVPWFFGISYGKVSLLLKIYSFVIISIAISNVIGNTVLNPTKNHNRGTIAVTAGATANLALNFFLIPKFRSVGAAISTVIAETIVTVLHIFYTRHIISLKKLFFNMSKFVILGGIMYVFLHFMGDTLFEFVCVNPIFITCSQIMIGILFYMGISLFVLKDEVAVLMFGMIKSVLKRRMIGVRNRNGRKK